MNSKSVELNRKTTARFASSENETSVTNEEEVNLSSASIADEENNLQSNSMDRPINPMKLRRRKSLASKICFFHDMNAKTRPSYLAPAMGRKARFCKRVGNFFGMSPKEATQAIQETDQHRVQPREEKNFVISVVGHIAVFFIQWCYRSRLYALIIVFTAIYFVFIILFALVLWKIVWLYFSSSQKECVTHDYFEDAVHSFELAFDLSWTTFSTVGYGIVAPSIRPKCWGVRVICAMEAFCGVIYAGFCGAILYSKLGRLLSFAPVTFSSAICLKYGDGITEQKSAPQLNATLESSDKTQFPVLEFRVVNQYANFKNRGIVDASVTCSAIISEGVDMSNSVSETEGISLDDMPRELPENYHHIFHHVSFDLKIETSKLPYYDKV